MDFSASDSGWKAILNVSPKRKAARSNRTGRAKKPTAFAAGFCVWLIMISAFQFLSTNTVSTESAANHRRVSAEYARCDSVFLYSRISDTPVLYTVVEHIGIAFQVVALLCTQPAKHQLINHRGAYLLD